MVGDDFRFGARRAGDLDMLRQAAQRCGYEVHAMPSVTADGVRVSSTAVREALAAGDAERAQRLLGRPYSISGRVINGEGLGRQLGCRTANIQMKHNRPPVSGIFAAEVHGIDNRVLPGVASLGVRPTVAHNAPPSLEVHLLDFDRDIYGMHLQLDFLHKFRDEEKYADVETLKKQIAADIENARAYFADRGRGAVARHG
jgi:riboflavin kinase/FMN adenylyltransferase